MSQSEVAKKAWVTIRRRAPGKKARLTDRTTETLRRALTMRAAKRWKLVSFRGEGGGEWRGIVDILAIRKSTGRSDHSVLKAGDLFEMILIQAKGGSARKPKSEDLKRLLAVKRRYRASEIVLFRWRREKECSFSKLKHGEWASSSATELFG